MKLHENKRLFRQAIQFTSDQMGILPIYIEKDYWVTFALYRIFNDEIGGETVFKGGTALSKCYSMIERFSEDIDLVVFRREEETSNQLSKKIKTIGKVVDGALPEVQIDGLTQKRGMNRKTAHFYSKEFKGDYGQVRDVIIIEATWLGYFEPFTTKSIISLVGQMMLNNGQDNIAKDNGLMPFDVRVLDPKRTLCEKIMSLVRFSYDDAPIVALRNKIRHCYDLHQLLKDEAFSNFLDSDEFDSLLLRVGHDDVQSFKNNNTWLANHPKDALMFKDLDNVWKELRSTYTGDFKTMVYGILPEGNDVFDTLHRIKSRLASIKWDVQIGN
ncbi:nucleotidyl transferase AbiEii/AbiGii toxin family protein [Sunxiuqinia rutila]|uniref:nucleotidyl transferase AbiEii/AbiGii toxin family protein n=1 Tax=Sunxiuqinia rutila TaxID=1397841 RepID=UPI003D35F200